MVFTGPLFEPTLYTSRHSCEQLESSESNMLLHKYELA